MRTSANFHALALSMLMALPVSLAVSDLPESAAWAKDPRPLLEVRQPRLELDMTPVMDMDPSAATEELPSLPAGVDASSPQATELKPAVNNNPLAQWNPFNTHKVTYTPLPGIVIFPVLKHGNEKAFGDLPVMFAREYAQRLELKAPETKVYHPVYTVDELRMQGLGHVYDQIMRYYLKAGRPEPRAMDYLLKQISTNSRPISRVVFVEADLDMTHPDQSTTLWEKMQDILTDGTPRQMRYFVQSRLQIFDAESPEFPMVWGGGWKRSIKANQFMNPTSSVFADSDSQQSFARLSRDMSSELLLFTPKTAYMEPHFDTSVQGNLVKSETAQQTMPDFSEQKAPRSRLSIENKEAIQRILQRQNAISP